jgi:hypothetical protein
MAIVQFGDMISEPASNKPTAGGTFNLSGTASVGFEKFDSQITSGNQVICSAKSSAGQMEFIGTYTNAATDTISVTTLRHSSTGSLINFSGGDTVVLSNVMDSAYLNRLELNAYNTENNGFVHVTTDGSSQQTPSRNASTKVSSACFSSELSDPLGWWDFANAKFTPLRAGKYMVSAWMQVNQIQDTQILATQLFKNGSQIKVGSHTSAGAAVSPICECTGIFSFNGSTDYMEVYVYYGDSSTNRLTSMVVGTCGFQAIYLGP